MEVGGTYILPTLLLNRSKMVVKSKRGNWTLKELEKEYPTFKKWIWEVHHCQTADGPWLIDLWYEYLEYKENNPT